LPIKTCYNQDNRQLTIRMIWGFAMRFIKGLSYETVNLLQRIYAQSQYHQVRRRAHCIILSNEGHTIKELMSIFHVDRVTIYNWFDAWEDRQLVGLYDRKGRGRKPKFNSEQKEQIVLWAKEFPRKIELVKEKIKETWNMSVSKDTIKRILKEANMSWRRIKKRVAGEPEPTVYQEKKKELEELKKPEDRGEIDLIFFDETGFCLNAYVPYAWQEKGEVVQVKSKKSKRLNVLGFLNRKNEIAPYLFECNINSEVIVSCIDDFCSTLEKKTVLVMDNASIHTSNAVNNKQKEWEQKGLTIFYLPTYSPQLNIIEILWRFIKYEWLNIDAYESWKTLVKAVEDVLREVGGKYKINFA